MTDIAAYMLVIAIALTIPIARAIIILLALEQRVILPLLRISIAGQSTHAMTLKMIQTRESAPTPARQYIITIPARFSHPRRTT